MTAQPLSVDPNGERRPDGQTVSELEARSGQLIRLIIRPVEGSARPSDAGCPVRVNAARLTPIARLLTTEGFLFDGTKAYAMVRVDEERTLDLEIKPFDAWGSVPTRLEVENLTIRLPETAEFVGRLPVPVRPPAGTICADVVHSDAQPAVGVPVDLAAPPEGPADRRPTGPDGRVCWDGIDEMLFGEVGLDDEVDTALGQPKRGYVSYEASYRLFVIRR